MSDTQALQQSQATYWQKKANVIAAGEAKIEKFMADVLAELKRRYPNVKMTWLEREKWDLPWRQPELIIRLWLNKRDWYFAIKELDVLYSNEPDELLIRNVHILESLITRELQRNS